MADLRARRPQPRAPVSARGSLAPEPRFEVWRGASNAWNCDEMGHLNVRFYLAFALNGLGGGLAAALGLEDAFSARATSTLEVKGHHIRFLKEARAGAPLHMEAGILSFGEDEAEVLLVMRHSRSGEPCAAIVSRIVHVTPGGRRFPWSQKARDAAQLLACARPDYAKAKGVTDDPAPTKASLARAEALGVPSAARTVVLPEECDALGRFRTDAAMGVFSDAAAQVFGGFGRGVAEGEARLGGVMLEAHILHHRPTHAGAHLWLRSGLAKIEPKFNHLVHWLLDPITGEALTTARALTAAFDLDARRIVQRTPEQLEHVRPLLIDGFDI
jgi:acyl-CoA thioester hydrolase